MELVELDRRERRLRRAPREGDVPVSPYAYARCGFATDIGMRELNEDSLFASSPVFVVADGMGGHSAGEVASRTAVDAFASLDGRDFVSAGELEERIALAARAVRGLASESGIPGTTLTGLVLGIEGGFPYARVFNIGDSRTYHLSGMAFIQVTKDHSEVQELIDAGVAEGNNWGRRNVITRALGGHSGSDVGADVFLVPLSMGDRFVLCSDGLSSVVSNERISEVARYMEDPQETAQTLVQKALGAGGSDNVTVVVVDIVDCGPQLPSGNIEEETVTAARRIVGDDTVPRRG